MLDESEGSRKLVYNPRTREGKKGSVDGKYKERGGGASKLHGMMGGWICVLRRRWWCVGGGSWQAGTIWLGLVGRVVSQWFENLDGLWLGRCVVVAKVAAPAYFIPTPSPRTETQGG